LYRASFADTGGKVWVALEEVEGSEFPEQLSPLCILWADQEVLSSWVSDVRTKNCMQAGRKKKSLGLRLLFIAKI
jgi:hypothetical protein